MDDRQLRALTLRQTDVHGAIRRLGGNEELYVNCLVRFLEDPTVAELNDNIVAQS